MASEHEDLARSSEDAVEGGALDEGAGESVPTTDEPAEGGALGDG
jgi:hypothetical protein